MIQVMQSKGNTWAEVYFPANSFHFERTDAMESPNVTLNQLKKIVSFLDACSTWLPADPPTAITYKVEKMLSCQDAERSTNRTPIKPTVFREFHSSLILYCFCKCRKKHPARDTLFTYHAESRINRRLMSVQKKTPNIDPAQLCLVLLCMSSFYF